MCPGPFVRSSLGPTGSLGAAAGGRRAARRRDGGRAASRTARHAGGRPTRALDGLKVVDLTWVFAGPLTTRVLAEHGATVVKVEGPAHPDASRSGGGALNGDFGIEGSIAFAHFNCRQAQPEPRSRQPDGARGAARPRRWADVLIESYTPGRHGTAGDWPTRTCAGSTPAWS